MSGGARAGGNPLRTESAISMSAHSFTGRGRRRHTRRGVRVAEIVAKTLISIGGVGTVAALALILVFLASVVVPLFQGAAFEPQEQSGIGRDLGADPPLALAVDEYRIMSWSSYRGGRVVVSRTDTGERLETRDLFP